MVWGCMFSKRFFVLLYLINLFLSIAGKDYSEPHGIVYFPPSANSTPRQKRSPVVNQYRSGRIASFAEEREFPSQIRYKSLSVFSKGDFACLVAHSAMSVESVYQQYGWYRYHPFREFLRTFPDHEERIRSLLEEKKQKYEMGARKLWGHLSGDYVFGLTKILSHEIWCIERSNLEKEQKQRELYYAGTLQLQKEKRAQEAFQQQKIIEQNQEAYQVDYKDLQDAIEDWHEFVSVYQEYECGETAHFHRRCDALESMQKEGALYVHRHYEVHQDVQKFLELCGCEVNSYTTFYGNQLQDALHQECIELLTDIAVLPMSSPAYMHQEALVDCIDAAREYNQDGLVYKASVATDFCSAFLAYSSAIVEGVACGLIGAIQDIIEHPVQTAACVIAGKYVLAYQLGKVLCDVADIGLTALSDLSRAKERWDDYIEPIGKIIGAINNKETTRYDVIKAGTALAVGLVAQHKLLGGLNKFYGGIRASAIEFAQKNSSFAPQHYMQTPNGMLLNVPNEAVDHVTDHLVNTCCPASCQQMYEKLKITLKIEEFTSIIDVTKHGVQRLIERGFIPEEVKILYYEADLTYIQTDGAKVFIKFVGQSRYNVMVYNQAEKGVVTALKNIDKKALTNLGKNHGWKL